MIQMVSIITIQKSIHLISRAVFDDLSTWMEYDGNGYVVANYNIQNTIIDGDGSSESVLYIETPSSGNCTTPTIQGFTIQNGGEGTEIQVGETQDGDPIYESFGGGFLAYNSLLISCSSYKDLKSVLCLETFANAANAR